jgi:hypothetical protein
LDEVELEKDLTIFLEDALDLKVMLLLPKTACQSDVARLLGVSQGLVRHRYLRSIEKMQHFVIYLKDNDQDLKYNFRKIKLWKDEDTLLEDFGHYLCYYKFLAANLNILRELYKDPDEVEEPLYEVIYDVR